MLINADIGEQSGHDESILPHIAVGNIACGCHASNHKHMAETVRLAIQHGVKISAHPGYNDRENFGRVSITHTTKELYSLVNTQVLDLKRICEEQESELFAIKPHGALYHDMMTKPELREVIEEISLLHRLPLIVQAMPSHASITWKTDTLKESFADRAYLSDGRLQPRSELNSLFTDSEKILQQAQQFIRKSVVSTVDKTALALTSDTLCFHGDNPASVEALQRLHAQD